jgi:DNA repair photolyase
MARVFFEEINCKSLINHVKAPGMRMRWTINPYRGCQHACVYCFARGNHQYLGYDSGRDFETRIIVKVNAVEVLREELRRPSWNRERVMIATACDPYQQAEVKYRLTRGILEALTERANPMSMLTKSPTILRDIDVFQGLAAVTHSTVAFSVPTLNEEVWKKTEPGTSKPIKRLEAMEKLAAAGITVGVMLAPVIPGVTDDRESLETVVRAAAEHGASFIADNVLHLKPGTKEWFMPFLREAYPHLLPRYIRYYRGAYAPESYTEQVHAVVQELREKWGMIERSQRPVEPHGQLKLAL